MAHDTASFRTTIITIISSYFIDRYVNTYYLPKIGYCAYQLCVYVIVPTNIVVFRGFDSSIILNLRVGILMSVGDSPESLSQAILVVIMLLGGLGVRLCF